MPKEVKFAAGNGLGEVTQCHSHDPRPQNTRDTALTTQDADGNKVVVPVPQGTGIVLHVPGLHYNRTLSSLSAAKGGP